VSDSAPGTISKPSPSLTLPPKPPPAHLVVRVATWVCIQGLVLLFPLLLTVGKVGFLEMAVIGGASIVLALISLFNFAGERDRSKLGFAYNRARYWLDRSRRFRLWYPAFAQNDWYLIGGSVLFLFVGLLFVIVGVSVAME
jgi:hypothetical protein